MADRDARQLHDEADNLTAGPHEVNVQRLETPEAVKKAEEALYYALIPGASQLRVNTGRRMESPLRLAIIGAMER
ncbi:hypothetical protein CERSUDRAFT_93421 [Gelatoporia subvermispora B]|uniref:Uncharacterized protein n=1 Tax=Ceriporiopsis subvermispora (strain B) TaxID=914234 RepID=M2QQN5_CERS8|nr:hypothetical protein CERSUDRAFT_93421 [Gelatoporia subvermispora B]